MLYVSSRSRFSWQLLINWRSEGYIRVIESKYCYMWNEFITKGSSWSLHVIAWNRELFNLATYPKVQCLCKFWLFCQDIVENLLQSKVVYRLKSAEDIKMKFVAPMPEQVVTTTSLSFWHKYVWVCQFLFRPECSLLQETAIKVRTYSTSTFWPPAAGLFTVSTVAVHRG